MYVARYTYTTLICGTYNPTKHEGNYTISRYWLMINVVFTMTINPHVCHDVRVSILFKFSIITRFLTLPMVQHSKRKTMFRIWSFSSARSDRHSHSIGEIVSRVERVFRPAASCWSPAIKQSYMQRNNVRFMRISLLPIDSLSIPLPLTGHTGRSITRTVFAVLRQKFSALQYRRRRDAKS